MTQTTITTYDKYMYFTWRGISSSKYNCFIVNDKHSLQFVNAPSFSNNYADAMYQNKSYFLGTSVQRKTLTFKVACDRITLDEYREFLSWLNIYSIGFLQLDYEDWYGYNVKLSALTESEKYPLYECEGKMVYMVVLTLTFETTDDFYAVHKYQTTAFMERYPLNYLASENLITNSDLLIDSNSDGVPDGFNYLYATDKTLVNGVAKFTPNAQYSRFYFTLIGFNTQKMYVFARFNADGDVRLGNGQSLYANHSGNGQFEFLSLVGTFDSNIVYPQIRDFRASGFTPIEVDYMGAINITDLINRGILPSGLTNEQYQTMLDNIFSLQGYQITDSIFNSEEKEEIHLSSNREGDQDILYIGLDNYSTLDTSFKLGISQMNGQFTFNYIIVDSTEWVLNPEILASHSYEYLGYIETNNLNPIYTTNLEYDSNSGQCTSSGILAARTQAQGQLIFKTIDMPGNIVIPAQKTLILKIEFIKNSTNYPSFMVQFQKRTQVI